MRHGVMASPTVSAAVCARASSGPSRRRKVRVAPRTRGSIPRLRITATERHRGPGDARASARDGRDDERDVMPRDASARNVHGRVALGAILASTLATVLMPESADAVETTAPTSVPSLSGRRAALDPRERHEPTAADCESEQGEITLAGDAFRFLTVEDAPEPAVDDGIASGAASSNAEADPSSQIKIDAPSLPEQVAAAVVAFLKPLLGEFGAAVLGFGVGAVASGFFMGWQQSKKSKGKEKTASRQALADLATMDESEIQELVGELPAWLAFRDVERAGWLNKVLAAAWPYLDKATSNVIVAALDPILKATRPSFLTTLSFERFSFGNIPARFEGVKVYETTGDGSVEIDLRVFWAGDPDVVLGVRAAQDSLSVPVSLTEFECSFTLRLIFAPLLGVFPCFGALTIALMEEPQLDFDLRVVGGDVTLVPGLKAPLKQYILALIASWMVWPRCITVAIPGTGYTLPVDETTEKPTAGLLHITVVGHDGAAVNPGEVGLQVRRPVADLLVDKNQSEARVKALPGGSMLSSRRSRCRWRTLGRSYCACDGTRAPWWTRTRGRLSDPRCSTAKPPWFSTNFARRLFAPKGTSSRWKRPYRSGDPCRSPRSWSPQLVPTSSPSGDWAAMGNRVGWWVGCGGESRAWAAASAASSPSPPAAWSRGTKPSVPAASGAWPRYPARW